MNDECGCKACDTNREIAAWNGMDLTFNGVPYLDNTYPKDNYYGKSSFQYGSEGRRLYKENQELSEKMDKLILPGDIFMENAKAGITFKLDDEIVENEHGGKQSKIDGRFDLIPGESLVRAAKVLESGAIKYGNNNWRRITFAEHLNHAERHLQLLKAGDRSEDHLANTLCRLLFAVAVEDKNYDFKSE